MRARLVVVPAVVILALAACSPEPSPTTPPSPDVSTTSQPATPVSTPVPTSSGTVAFEECQDLITDEFRAEVERLGWVGWNMVEQQAGYSPFDVFPDGAPAGQLSCRWGAGPDVATDNVVDLAWAPIEGDAASRAQEALTAAGYKQIVEPAGTYMTIPYDGATDQDTEDLGPTYLFTTTDVRYAPTREELDLIRATPE